MSESIFEKVGNFAGDAAVDTAADGVINDVIDGVASHVPGGGAVDAMLKTGVDLAANNAINAEIGRVEGMFGGHQDAAQSGTSSDGGSSDGSSSDDQS
ncbi:MAG: hypothetical protein JO225_08875 [Candidatus Eremiobacteraeota bacterium]|nr:hypothetical protein [Candidatus Eremiobacteraeota bacterium]